MRAPRSLIISNEIAMAWRLEEISNKQKYKIAYERSEEVGQNEETIHHIRHSKLSPECAIMRFSSKAVI